MSQQELCANALDVLHRYLLFAAALQYYARPAEIDSQLLSLSGKERAKNNLGETVERFPGVLEFFRSLLSSAFLNNPYYTEMVYSVLECIVVAAAPSSTPVIKFVSSLLFARPSGLKYQDMLLLNSVCSSAALTEAIIAESRGKDPLYANLVLPDTVESHLHSMFVTYLLCKSSEENKQMLDKQVRPIEFIGKFEYEKLSEPQQTLVLELMRGLVHGCDCQEDENCGIDYSVLLKGVDSKDIELSANIRGEVRAAYKALTSSSKTRQNPSPNQVANLHNLLLLLTINSSHAVQSRVLSELTRDLGESFELCNAWMKLETVDSLLEVYRTLSEGQSPLRTQYLKLISRIMTRGVSTAKPELFGKLVEGSQEFQQTILSALEEEDAPLSLRIDRAGENDCGYVCTLPMRSFPREKVGFSLVFWVKFSAITTSMTLFEFADEKGVILSFKYIISGSVSRASSGSQASRTSQGSGGAGSARGEAIRYFLSVEADAANQTKIELEAPLIEANRLTHVAVQYSRSSHCGYINGKQMYSSTKQGTANTYPMALAKGLRLRFSSQQKSLSIVTIYEGVVDPKTVMNLWLRGPIDEYTSTQKELGIDLPRVYRFPKPVKDESQRITKLIVEEISSKPDMFQCHAYPLIAKCGEVQPEYLAKLKYLPDSEFLSPNTKGVKGPDYELMGPVRAVLNHTVTLKERLSTLEFMKLLLGKLFDPKRCVSADEFSTLLQIVELLILRNEKYLTVTLKDLNLPAALVQLSALRHNCSPDWNADQQVILSVLFDLMCSQRDVVHELNVFSRPKTIAVPAIHASRFEYFRSVQALVVTAGRPLRETVLNVLCNLLTRQDNAEKLASAGLLTTLFHLFVQACSMPHDSDNFMYEKLLEVFQLFLHWHHILDWELLFAFFLLLKDKDEVGAQDVLADLLSITSVYVFVGGNKVALAEKFLAQNGTKLIFSLAESHSIVVVEHALKLLSALILASPKLKQTMVKTRGFDVLAQRLEDKAPTFSFLQTLLDFALGSFKVQSLYPQSNSYVSTVINRSPIASDVINQQTGKGESAAPGLSNAEALGMLFAALSRTKELHYRINMLSQLQSIFASGILSSEHNIVEQEAQKAIDSGIFVWIVEYFKCLETEEQQANDEVTSESLKKIVKMSLKLLCSIVMTELEKPPKHSKVVRLLQSIPSVDRIQGLMLDRLFKVYCKQDGLKKESANLIKNLSAVSSSLGNTHT